MNTLQKFVEGNPYLTTTTMPELVRLDRLFPVLVRCGGCRFTCAAQDVEHLVKCISAGGDYVRDVSFPVGSFDRASGWRDQSATAQTMVRAVNNRAVGLVGSVPDRRRNAHTVEFDESQCGGVFDGSQVTSDADSGL